MSSGSEIYNGAKCNSYCWSQSHSDLEIRIKLTKAISCEHVNVDVKQDSIRVEFVDGPTDKMSNWFGNDETGSQLRRKQCLIDGKFEHPVDTESVNWLLDPEELNIIIFIDKAEDGWWKKLMLNEEATEVGQQNYSIFMDDLDEASRMAVDKLIIEQRSKLYQRKNKLDADSLP